MTTMIAEATLLAWTTGRKTKISAKGWITGNCPCCIHNGESADKRGRGALIINTNSDISYHCFNCSWKCSFTNGYPLSYKFKKLLKWLNVDETEILRLGIEAKREQRRQEMLGLVKIIPPKEEVKVNFKKEPLPEESVRLLTANADKFSQQLTDAVTYLCDRKINLDNNEFFITQDTKFKMNKRVIIPFLYKNEIIGYSARALNNDIKPKYIQKIDSGYVFNIDKQEKNWKFVIVCEGIFDALSIDGIAVLKADITKQQIDIIENLDREIIVVPDWDKSGGRLIDMALQNGWSVSFPIWAETCKDINEAVQKYGKLFTLKTIIDGVEANELKIKILRKINESTT